MIFFHRCTIFLGSCVPLTNISLIFEKKKSWSKRAEITIINQSLEKEKREYSQSLLIHIVNQSQLKNQIVNTIYVKIGFIAFVLFHDSKSPHAR